MQYNSELQFLCEIFKNSHIDICIAQADEPIDRIFTAGLQAGFEKLPISELIDSPKPNTLYKTVDMFRCCYTYLLLPDMPKGTLLFIGPYIHTPLSPREIFEAAEQNGLSPKNQKLLAEYYAGVPTISQSSHLFTVINTFCERIWGGRDFSVESVENDNLTPVIFPQSDAQETLVSINLMEKRYSYENELIQAVTRGQVHKAELLPSALDSFSFEKRAMDPLRNMKNYCIIMNTLFRKAAENGGVLPFYIDKVSSDFARQIERAARMTDIAALMKEIFVSYCRLVRKHSMKNFSPIVQKAIVFIETDLTAELTLRELSRLLSVSEGYLATVFKKETGKTVTEYIRDERVRYAEYLLKTTQLQIQTVALHCGIMDAQYFSKIFKRVTGKTPSEYRNSL